jgi:hypothetical protein
VKYAFFFAHIVLFDGKDRHIFLKFVTKYGR